MEANTSLHDKLKAPLYGFAEADYIAKVKPGTSKRWLTGYSYRLGEARVSQPPVSNRPATVEGVSFLDLIEIVVIGRLRENGYSLPTIRRIVDNCRDIFNAERPLTTFNFKTDGREIFVPTGEALVEVNRRRGMQAWNEVLSPFLDELEYADAERIARRWWPLGKHEPVIVDPDYGFGLPVVAGKGVRVEIIAERFAAGDKHEEISEDFGLTREEIDAALRFELQRRAA